MPRQKVNREKSFNNLGSIEASIRFSKISGKPYQVIVSNYMTEIKGAENIKFVKEDKSKRCFSGYAKVKSDVTKSGIWLDVDKNSVSYYDVGDLKTTVKEAYNIDLKSAYATILYNSKMIRRSTFKYICGLSKEDRLACIGMLASHKYVFFYLGSEIIDMQEICSETENFFYFACEKTFQIMQNIKMICGESYLFSWVDSVYYTDDSKTQQIKEYLYSVGHLHSYDKIVNLEITEYHRYHKISFNKKAELEPTIFSIPKNASAFAKMVISKYTSKKRSFNGANEHFYRTDGRGNLRFYDYLAKGKNLTAKQRKYLHANKKKK